MYEAVLTARLQIEALRPMCDVSTENEDTRNSFSPLSDKRAPERQSLGTASRIRGD